MSVVPASFTSNGGNGNSISVNKPSGVASGDVLLIIAGQQINGNVTSAPTGFTEIDSLYGGNNLISGWTGYRVADGTEASTFTIGWSQTRDLGIVCIRLTGADATDLVTSNWTEYSSAPQSTIPGVTVPNDDSLWVLVGMNRTGSRDYDGTEYTDLYGNIALGNLNLCVQGEPVNAGATGDGSMNHNSFATSTNISISVGPASGTPPPTSPIKIKVGGTFQTVTPKIKVGGTFVEKTVKIKQGGSFS